MAVIDTMANEHRAAPAGTEKPMRTAASTK